MTDASRDQVKGEKADKSVKKAAVAADLTREGGGSSARSGWKYSNQAVARHPDHTNSTYWANSVYSSL